MDARAVVGERGGSIVPIRGANKYLVKRCIFIVVQRAEVRGRVACGCHDQHLRFVKVKVKGVMCVSELSLAALRRVALLRAALSQGMLSIASSNTYNMLHAFAFSSAASSVRKPPESERCTTCRQAVWICSDGTRTHADGTVRKFSSGEIWQTAVGASRESVTQSVYRTNVVCGV